MIFGAPPLILPPEKPAIVRASDFSGLPSWEEMQRRERAVLEGSFPFPIFCPRKSLTETLYDRTTGTNIGDYTAGAGLAALWNNNTSETAFGTSAGKTGTSGYAGKTLAASAPFSRAVLYGSNDAGFSTNTGGITITAYGKIGVAPSSSTDGTSIGTLAFTNTAGVTNNTPQTVTSTDTSTAWAHIWFKIDGPANLPLSEIQLYVMA